MSKISEEIKLLLEKKAKEFGPPTLIQARVVSVQNDATCTVELDDLEMDGIRLKSVVKNGNHFVVTPSVNSQVFIAKIDDSDEYSVLQVDEVDEVEMMIGQTLFKVDSNGVKIDRNGDDLKTTLSDLCDEILAIYAPKNSGAIISIRNKFNSIFS